MNSMEQVIDRFEDPAELSGTGTFRFTLSFLAACNLPYYKQQPAISPLPGALCEPGRVQNKKISASGRLHTAKR